MNETLQQLKNKGCDINDALKRCLNDEDFLLDCIQQIFDDENFDLLEKSIVDNDLTQAFNAAHSLKGVCGNFGLTPMFQILLTLVEHLRHQEEMDYYPLLTRLLESKTELEKIAKQ